MSATETQPPVVQVTAERESWLDDLERDGFAIVKGAVPLEKAEECRDAMMTWLESFGLGFDRNDPSTVHKDKLPVINEKGMCLNYAVMHENFAWKIRTEPGVVDAFRKIYNEKDLIVSFDAINFGFPNRKDLPPNKPWPHQDQAPETSGFQLAQGLVNMFPNGPNDGGLIVCKGAHKLSEQFHKEMAWEPRIPQWFSEWYGFTETGMKWLADHGCEWIKVSCEPGDLLLWDSRTPHYNLSSTTNTPRFCIYTCYMPVKNVSQEDLLRKKKAFENWQGTTHWPNARLVGHNKAVRDGEEDPHNRYEPLHKPVLDKEAFKLTGIPYIKSSV